jgi:hypothetical protein
VADGVEAALGVQAAAQVAIGREDPLLVVERAGYHLAGSRLDDQGTAASVDLLVG